MPIFILKDREWCKEHARKDRVSGNMMCRRTGEPIKTLIIGRSIHYPLFPGAGGGEVWNIHHMYCSGCTPAFFGPEHGTPIVADEIYEIRDDGTVIVNKSYLTGDPMHSFDWVSEAHPYVSRISFAIWLQLHNMRQYFSQLWRALG